MGISASLRSMPRVSPDTHACDAEDAAGALLQGARADEREKDDMYSCRNDASQLDTTRSARAWTRRKGLGTVGSTCPRPLPRWPRHPQGSSCLRPCPCRHSRRAPHVAALCTCVRIAHKGLECAEMQPRRNCVAHTALLLTCAIGTQRFAL